VAWTAEIARWTAAMVGSGRRLDFGDLRRDERLPTVDKHSTGGVGDKITIPGAGARRLRSGVPQAAGRGLGHTGGTWTSWSRSPASPAECRRAGAGSSPRSARRSSPPASWPRPTARSPARRHRVVAAADRQLGDEQEAAEGAEALVLDVKVGCGRS
jgi:thymidine phosphorylase